MSRPLVSILTPCYNSAAFIERFMECILNQSYAPIELILINDGSTDQTEALITQRQAKFKALGYRLIVKSQPNLGQAAAFNHGLPLVTGSYFTWIDSDDLITNDAIEKKVKYLENHPECDCVRSGYQVVHETNLSRILYSISPKVTKAGFFEDILLERTYSTAGTMMIKTQRLFELFPTKQIYQTRAGQNWQLILPIAYHCHCGMIDEALLTYVIRNQSHSHDLQDNYDHQIEVIESHQDVVTAVLRTIPTDQEKVIRLAKVKYTRRKLICAALFRLRKEAKNQAICLSDLSALTVMDKIVATLASPWIVRFFQRCKGYN